METKYKSIHEMLKNRHGLDLAEYEIEEIMLVAEKALAESEHVGISVDRIHHCEREKAFHDQWKKKNEAIRGINFGEGILQDLFINANVQSMNIRKWELEITKRERMIVATVIQWLGSNIGMEFLSSTLKKCGYEIVKKQQP